MAMLTGVKATRNKIICVIDGDGQNPPYEIRRMIDYWHQVPKDFKDFVLICGNRKNRQDTILKELVQRLPMLLGSLSLMMTVMIQLAH